MSNSLVDPNNLESAMIFAEKICNTQLVPQNFRGKPADILVAMQMGKEVGLLPMQSLQSISVINGKPSMYGDSLLAICRSHPDFEDIVEEGDDRKATCTVKRKGQTPTVKVFTIEQAVRAGLTSRSPVWKTYPERMLQMRARGFALRDAFPDALGGMISTEEASDYPPKDKPKNPMNIVSEKKSQVQTIAEKVIEKIEVSKKTYKVFDSIKNKDSCVEFDNYEDAYELYEQKRNEILTSSAKDKNKYLQIFMQMNNELLKNNEK